MITMDKRIKFPYKIEDTGDSMSGVKVFTEKTTFKAPTYYKKYAETIYNFKVRPDDVWVVTFPKSGTTLTLEMVWMIVNGEEGYEIAKTVPLFKRCPFFEQTCLIGDEAIENAMKRISDEKKSKNFWEIMRPKWESLEETSSRRFIKTHLPFPLLPPNLLSAGCKVFYVARNPKDVAVSFSKFTNFKDDDHFSETWDFFQNDQWKYGPYWDHLKLGWEARFNKNVCFMFYEDMVKDLKSTVRTVSQFLEKDLTDEQVNKMADHLHIDNMRQNESVTRSYRSYLGDNFKLGPLVREGKPGGWRRWFSDELNVKANRWIEDHSKNTDMRFPIDFQ